MPKFEYYNEGEKIVVNTDAKYFKCLQKLNGTKHSAETLRTLVRNDVIRSHEKEKFSSHLQTLMDKGLVEHRGSVSEYGVTDLGKTVLSEYEDYVRSFD